MNKRWDTRVVLFLQVDCADPITQWSKGLSVLTLGVKENVENSIFLMLIKAAVIQL